MSPAEGISARSALSVACTESHLRVDLPGEHEALSWAIVGGGRVRTRAVVWCHVRGPELAPPAEPREVAAALARPLGTGESTIVLLTSRRLSAFEHAVAGDSSGRAEAIATVGIENALAAGDPADEEPTHAGTINVLCRVDRPLSEGALTEALALSTEARAAALFEAGVRSRVSDRAATGTGTDCNAVVAPVALAGAPVAAYVGKYTRLGAAIGASVREAVLRGALACLAERERR
ncbi:MAG: hypothetical protein FJ144_09500 [Deltaproteobacteria bacterium]|nr:hypothetical protein [Deltaproteobacteria bacterium]